MTLVFPGGAPKPVPVMMIENACPIAAEFPAYAALAPAPFDLEAFEEEELGLLAGAGEELFGSEAYHDFETFVAAAVAR